MVDLFASPLLPPTEGYAASDGTFWRTEGWALLHDMIELAWARLLPAMCDGTCVRQTRLDLGLSQADLARASEISQAAISLIESGKLRLNEPLAGRVWSALCRVDQQRKAYTSPEILLRIADQCSLQITTIERLGIEVPA
jgi:hypothetical protein